MSDPFDFDEATERGLDFVDTISADVKQQFADIRIGGDSLCEVGTHSDVAEVDGILVSVTTGLEAITWSDIDEACDEIRRRFDAIGLSWEMNETMERSQWEIGMLGPNAPYAEFLTEELTDEHITRYHNRWNS